MQRKPLTIFNIHWIIEKARAFQKNIYFCFIDCIKAFVCECSRGSVSLPSSHGRGIRPQNALKKDS